MLHVTEIRPAAERADGVLRHKPLPSPKRQSRTLSVPRKLRRIAALTAFEREQYFLLKYVLQHGWNRGAYLQIFSPHPERTFRCVLGRGFFISL